MSEDRIERETLIDASLERVWSLVTVPGFWVAEEASVAGTVATEGALLAAKNPHLGEVWVRVEKVEPPTYVAYRWNSVFPGEELSEDNSTLVEFTLSTEGGRTRLRVVESGFATLKAPDEKREQARCDNITGWAHELDAAKARAEQAG
ncbi:SRPBCC domain-containing protein [Nonomuraea sp. NPDC050783]|uniref:SRPBCC domain-containing protein n=1 Tax=Nonomuraea sp. NPDC050783 TaxID=3154634 RepID=UPI003467C38A